MLPAKKPQRQRNKTGVATEEIMWKSARDKAAQRRAEGDNFAADIFDEIAKEYEKLVGSDQPPPTPITPSSESKYYHSEEGDQQDNNQFGYYPKDI